MSIVDYKPMQVPKQPIFPYKAPDLQNRGALNPTALQTSGSGAALQSIPKRTQHITRVEVNSYDRNYNGFATSNEFVWNFQTPLKDIMEIRIVGGTIPTPVYNIDVGYNQCVFFEYEASYTMTIPPGLYTAETLASTLETLLNSVGLGNTYKVEIGAVHKKLVITRISGDASYGFLFMSGGIRDEFDLETFALIDQKSLAMIFGWSGVNDVFCNDAGVLEAPYIPNLSGINRIMLYVSYDASIDFRSITRGQGRREPSAIFYIDPSMAPGSYKTLDKDTYENIIDPGSAPISKINNFRLSFRDEFYRPLNLQNKPVSLLLEITHYT
jgi:hypothetical protein